MERLNFDILDENHDVTALEVLSTQIGGEWSARKRIIGHFWSQNLTVDLRRIYLTPGIWQHDRNNIVTTNAQNNYILFEFFPSITKESWTDMHTESTKVPTCWQQAGETRLAA